MRKGALSRFTIRLDCHRYWREGLVPANNNKQKCPGTKLRPILLQCTCRGNFGKDGCEQLMPSMIHLQKMLYWENSLVLSRWKAVGTECRFSTFLRLHHIALHLLQNVSDDRQWFTTRFLTYENICICVHLPSYFISETNSLKWSK